MKPHNATVDDSLKPGEVHVWSFHLDRLNWMNSKRGLFLSGEEVERSKKYKFDVDRLRFLARRSLLRLFLSQYGGMPPEKIIYQVNQHGKLSLPASRISFNLSSSQDWVSYAFALGSEVGVDMEQVRSMPDMLRVAKRCFSLEEQAGLFDLPLQLQAEAFFHIWTQKEAFIKARGVGLAYPLKDFSVSVDPGQPARLLAIKNAPGECRSWKMANAILDGDWRVAVCIRMEGEPQVVWHRPLLEDLLEGINS